MILVLNVCYERLHFFEFVRPVLDILEKSGKEVLSCHYLDLTKDDLERCDKIIICGTSLKDNKYIEDLEQFFWLKDFDKPVLGICAGFQILGLVFGGKLEKEKEIGFFKERFVLGFLGLEEEVEVYHLHDNYIELSKDWEVFSEGEVLQAAKFGNFYGVLFHPEVRNREVILRFVDL